MIGTWAHRYRICGYGMLVDMDVIPQMASALSLLLFSQANRITIPTIIKNLSTMIVYYSDH